ncbi:TPA: response regulator [Bacillus pseudomycoides]|nr:response regulator [Bacillus pseudomycoides]
MKQQSILVVDDDKDIVQMIEVYLQQEGYKVVKAYDGEQALQLFSEHDIELAILDIMMPIMDGIEVCRRIRENYNIPVMFLSAKSTDVDKVIGLSTGADDYIGKPFSIIELVARVKAQLRRYTYLNEAPKQVCEKKIQIRGLENEISYRV